MHESNLRRISVLAWLVERLEQRQDDDAKFLALTKLIELMGETVMQGATREQVETAVRYGVDLSTRRTA